MYILSTGYLPLQPKALFFIFWDWYFICLCPLICDQVGYLLELANSFKALPVRRQGRHASWLPKSPHCSCNCHNTGQLLSKLNLCTPNRGTHTQTQVLAACSARSAASDWVYSSLFRNWSKLWNQWEVKDQSVKSCCCCCFTCAAWCLANLGFSSCGGPSVLSWTAPGSLMFQRIQHVNKLPQRLCISPPCRPAFEV